MSELPRFMGRDILEVLLSGLVGVVCRCWFALSVTDVTSKAKKLWGSRARAVAWARVTRGQLVPRW